MEEGFELPVTYQNKELMFPAELQQTGYSHRFRVDVYGQDVFFEPDEERNYRALIDPEKITKYISAGLLQAIAETIESLVK
jgi:hypothetical protein